MKNTSSKLVEPRGSATKTATKSAKPKSTMTSTKTGTSSKSKASSNGTATKVRRTKEKSPPANPLDMLPEVPEALSTSERTVLNVFRRYQMTPGQMLCFSGSNLDSHKATLAKLIGKQMLLSEKFRGGYSLTKLGFAAMMTGAPTRD